MKSTKPLHPDSMRQPITRPWCRDEKPMTPERILAIAKNQGEFTVHRYLYRADALRRCCRRMVASDLLVFAGRRGDFLAYKAKATAP